MKQEFLKYGGVTCYDGVIGYEFRKFLCLQLVVFQKTLSKFKILGEIKKTQPNFIRKQ